MKFVLVTLFIGLSVLYTHAQIIVFASEADTFQVERKEHVVEYFKYVHKAERKLTENLFEEASQYYYKAFLNKTPFINDLANAVRAERVAGMDSGRMTNYLIWNYKLNGGKLTADDFFNRLKKVEHLCSLPYFYSWKPILDTVQVTEKFQVQLVKRLREIDEEIQERIKAERIESGGPIGVENYEKLHFDFLDEFIAIHEKHGPFTEAKFGTSTLFYPLLFHLPGRMASWYPKIKQDYFNGDFAPAFFDDMSARIEGRIVPDSINIFGYRNTLPLFDKFVVIEPEPDELYEINKRRAMYMLDTFEADTNKRIWQWRTKGEYFLRSQNIIGYDSLFGFPEKYDQLGNKEKERLRTLQDSVINSYKTKGINISIYELEVD